MIPATVAAAKNIKNAVGNKNLPKSERARKKRIDQEIIADCYGGEEQMSGWWHYLFDALIFPFTAKCSEKRSISPLEADEIVKVVGMAPSEDCASGMFVIIEWGGRKLGVPINQLEVINVSKNTRQAIEDWRYWSFGSLR